GGILVRRWHRVPPSVRNKLACTWRVGVRVWGGGVDKFLQDPL
ncbi:rCG51265, partial [Rattus norvegicus]